MLTLPKIYAILLKINSIRKFKKDDMLQNSSISLFYFIGGKQVLKNRLILFGLIISICITKCETLNGESNINAQSNITYASNVNYKMCKADYWISKTKDPDKVLMSEKEISNLNQRNLEKSGTNMNDLNSIEEIHDGKKLKASFMKEVIPKEDLYIHGKKIDKEKYFEKIKENIMGADTSNKEKIKYAISTERADIKCYPTTDIIGYSSDDVDDEIQSSVLNVNEPFIVKLTTKDGKFCWGMSVNCSGWVETKKLAFCKDKEKWNQIWNNDENILVVTMDKILLEESYVEPATSKVQLTLGTVLNLVPENKIPNNIGERAAWNNYVVYLPGRDEEGNYEEKIALIPMHYNVSVGYMKLTKRNIINVAFSCLGNRYGWGGMLGAMDCSLYLRNIYKCFGIELPRNTSNQQNISAQSIDVADMSNKEKGKILDNISPGALLYLSGHTMMYLGKDNGKYYVINAAGSMIDLKGENKSVYSIVVNTLDAKRINNKKWMTNINKIVCPWKRK